MRPKFYILINFALIVYLALGASGAHAIDENTLENMEQEYLLKIQSYIKEHKIDVSPAVPSEYRIKEITEGEKDGKPVLFILLDCCYMGDSVILDKESKEVISFNHSPI